MNYKIVTAFDETSLQHSTFHLLNEFKDNWEPSIEFHCYYYDLDLANYSLPKAKNIFYHNLMEISDYPDFLKTFAQHNGTEGGKIPYNDILNPLKYIPKVIALTECAFDSTDGWLFWLDPSCMNIKNVYHKDIDTIFPEHSDKLDLVTFTDMEQLVGFNLDKETPVRLLGDLRGAFISGEFLNYREWHDSFIFDRLKLIYNAHGMKTLEVDPSKSIIGEMIVNMYDRENFALRDKEGKRIFKLSDTETTQDILPSRYKQLADLVRCYKPKTILETGTWNGGRAIEMALAAFQKTDEVHYIGYDLFEDATTETDHEEFNVKPHNTLEAVHKRLVEFSDHVKEKENKEFTFQLTKGNVRETLLKKDVKDVDFALIGSGNSIKTVKTEYKILKDVPVVVGDHYFTKESEEDESMPPEKYHGVKNVFDSVKTKKVDKKETTKDGWTSFDQKSTTRKHLLPSQDKVAGGGHTHLVVFLHGTTVKDIPSQLKSVPIVVHPRDCVPKDYIKNNIKSNMTLIDPKKWVTKHMAHQEKAILVSAGPYLDYGALKMFIKDNPDAKLLTVKHAYPHLIANGIKPWGCVILDPRPITGVSTHNVVRKDLFKNLDPDTNFFVASMTDPSVTNFFISKECKIWGWHAFTDSLREEDEQGTQIQNQQVKVPDDLGIPKGATMITGGTCAAMRGIGILHTMGFRNIDLFGFDSCRDEPSKEELTETTGDIEGGEVPKPKYIEVSVDEKKYWTTGELLAMAQDCEKVFQDEGLEGVLTFHGKDTMVADLWDIQQKKKTRPEFEGYYDA
tara:strand:+ start:829 stop:3201 length:2373 start_codon:yes stop_codon:yes gene_type:complete